MTRPSSAPASDGGLTRPRAGRLRWLHYSLRGYNRFGRTRTGRQHRFPGGRMFDGVTGR